MHAINGSLKRRSTTSGGIAQRTSANNFGYSVVFTVGVGQHFFAWRLFMPAGYQYYCTHQWFQARLPAN